jgi:predicted unusual protein kinase regulating ubiquinone biosynthesis (AarF/ABC1/UbiB family)
LNPGNIIIDHKNFEDEPKLTLIDFNVAKRFKDKNTNMKLLMMTNTGAAAFSSPEI